MFKTDKVRRIARAVALAMLAATAGEVLHYTNRLNTLEMVFYDLWHNLLGKRAEPEHVAIVAIDDESLLEWSDEPLVFWGPHFADAIATLREVGVRMIGLDYLFGVSPESWLKKLELGGSKASRTYDVPFRTQLASGKVILVGVAIEGKPVLLPIVDYLYSLPNMINDVALANLPDADGDGVIRHFVPALEGDTAPNLTIPARLVVGALGLDPAASEWQIAGQVIPRSSKPRRIGFVGPPGTVPRVSFKSVVSPGASRDPEVRALKDRIVLIAADHAGMQDIHLTPYARGFPGLPGRMMSGAELHVNSIETLLTGRFAEPVPSPIRAAYILLAAFAGAMLFLRISPFRGFVLVMVIAPLAAIPSYLAFKANLIVPVVEALLMLPLTYLGAVGLRLTGEERERARLRRMFGKYVSDEVVEKLVTSGREPDLGGEPVHVTVLFSDIRDFTTISEQLDPHEVVEMLNAYFSRQCRLILEAGGTVDKFVGDAIMAVFGSPVPYPDHARRALRAAVGMLRTSHEFREWMSQRFAQKKLPSFRIGIGIHTGKALAGNLGSPKRMEFTVIGDTVNTASRLEGVTKDLGIEIAASVETVMAAGDGVRIGKRQQVKVKGREKPVEVCEFMGLEGEDETAGQAGVK